MQASGQKYRNRRVQVDGIVFDSRREGERWLSLCDRQRDGLISNLRRQVRFPLEVNGQIVCRYVADFCYDRDGERVVEDVKGYKTPMYRLKKKLMKAVYGIEIEEI